MTFDEILAQVLDLLQRERRLSYRAIKVRFGLDDDHLEALKDEIIEAKQLAVDERGRVLVWTGDPASAPPPAATPTSARVPVAAIPTHLAEKILTSLAVRWKASGKQVTVLFADLKDSTELIRGLDPEAAQQLLDPALHRMMDAVHRFEGTVNQVLGDGIMALFGAPIAHEDHALRACYAALAMQAAMQPYTDAVRRTRGRSCACAWDSTLVKSWCAPLATTCIWTTRRSGRPRSWRRAWEQTATPGSIRLTPATLRLVEGLVQVTALGPVPVKGLVEPVEVFELTGASGVRRRLLAAAARGLTRFVGRDQELVVMQQTLEQASAGHGQVVALVGEAGVGSRAWYTSACTPTARRAGGCSKAPRCRMARPRRTSRSSTC